MTDLDTEIIGDANIVLSQLSDAVSVWREVDMEGCLSKADEDVMQLGLLRSQYLTRRKELTSKVREFVGKLERSSFDDKASTDGDDGGYGGLDQASCRALVDAFKLEFDFLGTLSKFAESSFAELYGSVRDAPAALPLLEKCLGLTERSR